MSSEIAQLEPPSLVNPNDRSIDSWLQRIPERKRSAVIQYAAGEQSVVMSYLYASMMGMEASVDDWEAWCIRQWKKLDHRALLQSEIVNLHNDIAEIRNAVQEGRIRQGDAPTKLSYLSRELRGHIEHLSKEVNTHDRRALLLAGVEVCAKNLRKIFGRNGAVWPAIEATLEATYADIEARHAL